VQIRLDGKTALVTGASSGIGLAIAASFLEAGASVMLSSRKESKLEAAVAQLEGERSYYVANAGDPEAVRQCVEATVERFGSVDVLVNNAATNPFYGRLIDLDVAAAQKTVLVNQYGPIAWAAAAWRAWMAEHGGSIVNISANGAYRVAPGLGWYESTKAALIHLTEQLAFEFAPSVRVNAIAPGLVKTELSRALWSEQERVLAESTLALRLGEPEDIARATTFLASDAASWITGTTLVVDGGMLCVPPAAEGMTNAADRAVAPRPEPSDRDPL